MAKAGQQLEHLAWHGDTLDHWHVGVVALDHVDGDPNFTEHITTFFGAPIHRLLDMPRDAIRAVPYSRSSCHRETTPSWPERGPTIP